MPVDVDEAAALFPQLAGERDQALHERPASVTPRLGEWRRFEHNDVPSLGTAKAIREPVRNDAIRVRGEAAPSGTSAVKRRFHRRGRNAVRLGYLRLERKDDANRERNRNDPVEESPERTREARSRTVEEATNRHAQRLEDRGKSSRVTPSASRTPSGLRVTPHVRAPPRRLLGTGYMSRMIVTGPSLTNSTSMLAPNTPVSTWTPSTRSASQKCS